MLPKSEEVYMKWGTGIHIDFTCPPISTDIASLLSIDILDIPVIIDTSRPAFCCRSLSPKNIRQIAAAQEPDTVCIASFYEVRCAGVVLYH